MWKRKQLKTEFDQRAARPDHLERQLEKLESTAIESVSFAVRSKAIYDLTQAIFNEAAAGRFWDCAEGDPIPHLYEEPFQREIDQIVRLLGSLALSEKAKQWVVMRSIELGVTLKDQVPYEETNDKWPALSVTDKLEILKDIARAQTRIFAKDAIDFAAAPIELHEIQGLSGSIIYDPKNIEAKHVSPVNIHRKRLEQGSFSDCAMTIVHEQLHSIFIQLAIAAHHDWMPTDHPLAEDAEKLLARHKHLGFGHFMIRSAYLNDPEENLTYLCQYLFNGHYADHYTYLTSETPQSKPAALWENFKNLGRKLGL